MLKEPKETKKEVDLLPITTMMASSIQQNGTAKPLLILFDSGTRVNWIRRGALPKGVVGKKVDTLEGTTLAGGFKSNIEVVFKDMILP